MRLFKTIQLLWTFYKNYFLLSLVINACCLSIFWKYGFDVFVGLFWLKLASLALSFYFINQYKNKEYFYYLNLGISKRLLWVATLSFDLLFFLLLINLLYQFR